MSKSRGSAQRGRRGIAVVVALAMTCGAVILGSAGTASAGNLIVCGGTIAPPAGTKNADTEARYNIQCSEDIRSFAVVSSKTLDFFGTETDVTPTVSQSATLQCEGTVPGNGFGCGVVNRFTSSDCGSAGKPACNVARPCGQTSPTSPGNVITAPCTARVSAGNFISADISFVKSPCLGKPKVWVTASSEPVVTSVAFTPSGNPAPDTNTIGDATSQPWRLKLVGFKGKKCAKTRKQAAKEAAKSKRGSKR